MHKIYNIHVLTFSMVILGSKPNSQALIALHVFFFFQTMMASSYGKFFKIKKVCENILTHKSKCVFNQLCTLFFIKTNVLKNCSSFINPIIQTVQISTNLNHSNILQVRISIASSRNHGHRRGFRVQGLGITILLIQSL